MGVNLQLLVADGNYGDWGYSHTLLETGRDYEFHDELRKMNPARQAGFKLHSYVSLVPDGRMQGEACYGVVEETPYGEPLTYLTAGEVFTAWCIVNVPSPSARSPQLRAAMAYVKELDSDTLVALYWHKPEGTPC